jgi:hypothetical protein
MLVRGQERPVPEYHVEPVYIGPTWQRGDDGRFILPAKTLGWQALAWLRTRVNSPDGNGKFKPTKEQARFILWWYAVDDRGRFVYRDGIFQRLKGHGKDPLVAALSILEMLGPCRFSHWATVADPASNIAVGDPVARDNPVAWIQVAAVSKDQTRNTMTLLPAMISTELMEEHGMTRLDIGKEIIYAHRGARRIEAVTSSPRALEGGRPTLVIRNETHHWIQSNDGHQMARVIQRNATKSAGGQARALSITNAYDPSEDSVAQHQREAWEAEQQAGAIDTGILYDSVEAPETIGMQPPEAKNWKPTEDPEELAWREACIKAWIGTIVEAVRGDSSWLDVENITKEILSQQTQPADARRFWFNNITSAADKWADPMAVKAAIDPMLRSLREHEREGDQLRLGWIVDPDDQVAMFFDGSKNNDTTGIVGVRISDGFAFTIGAWAKPRGEAGKIWQVPREEVSDRVDEAFGRFNVIAFFGDPSHTKEDDGTRFWDGYIDRWHRQYRDRLLVWAVQSGEGISSVLWDMTSPQRTAQFTAAAERVRSELHHRDHEGRFAPKFTIDGHPLLVQHLRNAHENRTDDGVSLRKKNSDSDFKIDLAVCLVGAQMLRRLVLNKLDEEDLEGETSGGWVTAL